MVRVKETLYCQHPEVYKDIEAKAVYQLQELNAEQCVQDDIFRILKNVPRVHLLKFPVKDENLTAFKAEKKDIFIFINSYLPLEKQIYGAAHELYHVLYENEVPRKEEVLKDVESPFNGDMNEMKANSFAACFLIPKPQLMRTIERLKINKQSIELVDVIKLMDVFAVPYKAMILRLHETEIIDEALAEQFLKIPDREPQKGVLLLINQTRHAIRWQKATEDYEYSNFIELAIRNYTENIISFEQLQNDFSKIITDEKVEKFLEG